ncbi:MAG: VCBS repeat-containing protein, partial [Bacteroidales bacterium]|nr:VCBS repeat-containing protein [Bacteroidales bacterium]
MNSKPLLFLILFLCFQLNTIGQTFQETILSSNFTDPYTLKVIDLDSNGHDDIIVCGASELSWFKNLNGLSYDKVILFDSVTGVLDFDLVDYDADLDMDIVAITANSIFWLENTGNS